MVGGVRSNNVSTFAPGQTIEIVFDEYVNHPSHYRIAFDADGDDDFADPVCLMNCDDPRQVDPTWAPDATGSVLMDLLPDGAGGEHRIAVTLPNVECEQCTLQVIQVMYDKRPYTIGGDDNYYQCADLVLRAGGPPPDAGLPLPDGGILDAGPDAGVRADVGPPGDGPAPTVVSAGCRAASPGPLWSFALVWLVLLVRRRTPFVV